MSTPLLNNCSLDCSTTNIVYFSCCLCKNGCILYKNVFKLSNLFLYGITRAKLSLDLHPGGSELPPELISFINTLKSDAFMLKLNALNTYGRLSTATLPKSLLSSSVQFSLSNSGMYEIRFVRLMSLSRYKLSVMNITTTNETTKTLSLIIPKLT